MDAVLATTSPDVEYAVQTERATAGSSGIFRVTSLKRRITEASSGSYSDSTLNASGSATSAGAIDGWGASSGEPGMLAVPMPQPLPPVGLAALVAGASDRAAHVETEHKRIIGPGDLARAERRKVFFTDLISHIAAFKEYHNRRRELTRRLATFASRMRMEAQRKAEMRERVEEQRRLRAMKEANKDAYLNLIKQGKEERITYLLEQTETYLAGLGDLVEQQKEAARQFEIDAEQRRIASEAAAAAKAERKSARAAKRAEKKAADKAAKLKAKEQLRMQAKGVVDAAAATADGDGSNAGAPETSAAAGGADSGAGSAMEVDDGDADDHEDADDDHGDHEADDYDSGDDEDAQHIDGMNVDEGGGSTTAADGQQHQPGQSPATAGDAAVGTGGGAGAASSSSSAAVPAPAVAGGEVGLYGSAHRIQEKLTKQPKLITGGTLQPYQVVGVEWLVSLYNNRLNGILADEMGLGKTVQTISLLAHLMGSKNNKGPFLVCVPLSTMSNWANEFARWSPAIRVEQYKGTAVVRKEIQKRLLSHQDWNVLLTTYEYAMRDKSRLGSITWQYIIVDEGHRLKNANAKFTQILGQDYQSRYRLLITGTPLQNSLPELWSLLNFVLPKVFGSVEDFEAWFSKPFAAYKGAGNSGNSSSNIGLDGKPTEESRALSLSNEERLLIIDRLHAILRPFLLRRVKSQVLTQLPEKVERVVRCGISAWQRIQYTQIQKYGCVATEPEANRGTSKGLANLIIQLRKTCNHPYLLRDSYNINDELWRSSGKFELLDRMLPKLKIGGHRVLIFSQMTALLDILGDYLDYRHHKFLRLDGTTSAEDREKRMKAFNVPDSEFFIFLLSTRAGGLGINLVTADTVIIFDSDWNPTADAQAQDRAHRIGQTREVRVLRLITVTPVEETILSRATDKATMEALVIEAGNFGGGAGAGSDALADGKVDERKQLLENLVKEELSYGSSTDVQQQSGAGAGARRKSKGGGSNKNDPSSAGGGDDDREDSSSAVPDDEAINGMIARSEDEFKLFQRMDVERVIRERKEGHEWALAVAGASSAGIGQGDDIDGSGAGAAAGDENSALQMSAGEGDAGDAAMADVTDGTAAASTSADADGARGQPGIPSSSSSSAADEAAAAAASHVDDASASEVDIATAERIAADVNAHTRARLMGDDEVPAWARFSQKDLAQIQASRSASTYRIDQRGQKSFTRQEIVGDGTGHDGGGGSAAAAAAAAAAAGEFEGDAAGSDSFLSSSGAPAPRPGRGRPRGKSLGLGLGHHNTVSAEDGSAVIIGGKSMRARTKEVRYTGIDELGEEEFARLVDEGIDPKEYVEKKRKEREERAAAKAAQEASRRKSGSAAAASSSAHEQADGSGGGDTQMEDGGRDGDADGDCDGGSGGDGEDGSDDEEDGAYRRKRANNGSGVKRRRRRSSSSAGAAGGDGGAGTSPQDGSNDASGTGSSTQRKKKPKLPSQALAGMSFHIPSTLHAPQQEQQQQHEEGEQQPAAPVPAAAAAGVKGPGKGARPLDPRINFGGRVLTGVNAQQLALKQGLSSTAAAGAGGGRGGARAAGAARGASHPRQTRAAAVGSTTSASGATGLQAAKQAADAAKKLLQNMQASGPGGLQPLLPPSAVGDIPRPDTRIRMRSTLENLRRSEERVAAARALATQMAAAAQMAAGAAETLPVPHVTIHLPPK